MRHRAPLPQFISLVLAVHIANEGQMSEVEAHAILNVTERRPKWLLSQVHPDKHQDFSAEATARARAREPSNGCAQQACD